MKLILIFDKKYISGFILTALFTAFEIGAGHQQISYYLFLVLFAMTIWSGNYYALRLMERLGLEAEGGAVRIGLAHYNTREEVDRLIDALHEAPK